MNLVGEPTSKRRWRKSRYAAEYLLLRALVGLLNILPLDFGSWLMGAVWEFVAPHLRRHEIALRHLTAAYPAKSANEIDVLARSMWTHLGRTFAESLMVERIVEAGRLEDCCGPLIRKMKASGKGVVFVSLHTGNWELVVIPTITGGIEVAGVYQGMKNPEVDRYVALMRRGRYPRGLYTKGTGTARKLMRIVREGGAVALLADLREFRRPPRAILRAHGAFGHLSCCARQSQQCPTGCRPRCSDARSSFPDRSRGPPRVRYR